MTYLEATEKVKSLFWELNTEKEKIINKAVEQGRWQPGLDSNANLFSAIDAEYKEKIEKLWNSIDDWTGYHGNS